MKEEDIQITAKKDFDEFKEQAKSYSIDDIRSGNWFSKLIKHSLKTYSQKVDANYFESKYPYIPIDGIVDQRIKIAKKYSAAAGAITSSAYSVAVASTIGSAGGASPLTIPGAISTFTADLLICTNIQLRLAYDISILYDQKIDINDPEDLMSLIKVAFGIKGTEVASGASQRVIPELVRQGVKRNINGAVLNSLKSLPVVGKHLLQRNIIKFTIPLVNVPITTAINYFSTGSIAKTARRTYRNRAFIKEKGKQIVDDTSSEYLILLQTVWLVIMSDGRSSTEEINLLNEITKLLSEGDVVNQSELKDFRTIIKIDEDKVINEIISLDKESRLNIYQAACTTAAADYKIKKQETVFLKKIALACGLEYDDKVLKAMAKQ